MNQELSTTVVGHGRYRYEAVPGWPTLPAGFTFQEAVGVATDSGGRVYVFNRGEHPVAIFSPEGEFLGSWGEGQFERPHGIMIGPDDALYLTDDCGHTVGKYTRDGRLLLELGVPGQPSVTGHRDFDYRTIERGGPPFRYPTNVALGPESDIYVSDGYGNARVHRFAPDGRLIRSWGEPGSGPGQFNVPHGIAIDPRGRVIVADRENDRLQFFSFEGELLGIWPDLPRPSDIWVGDAGELFVVELGWQAGRWPWMAPDPEAPCGRLSIYDPDGAVLARWGSGNPLAPDGFYAPHDIWVDRAGALYVAEVTLSASRGAPEAADYPTLRRFLPVGNGQDR
jgi:sugar lactone lactonase YvrE